MKRYLFISDTHFNSEILTGAHRRFLELVRCVSENNDVTLVSEYVKQLDGCNLTWIPIKRVKTHKIPKHIKGMLEVMISLPNHKNIEYDYVISFGPTNTVCYFLRGYKRIVSLFREDLIEYRRLDGSSSKFKIAYFSLLERLAVKKSSMVIVQCVKDRERLIQRVQKYIPNVAEHVYVQINNCNCSWGARPKVRMCRNGNITKIIFISSFFNRLKGNDLLMPAVTRLLNEGYQIELSVLGGGRELENYKRKYEEYPQIFFYGYVSDISQYIEEADFMVVPSRIDSCPNTALEGLNCGIAVYGSNVGGIPDILGDHKYLFEPNVENLYLFLREIIDTKRYIGDAEQQMKRRKELSFDWGNKIVNLIEKTII